MAMAVFTQKRLLLDAVNYLVILPSRRELGKEDVRRELLPLECFEAYELYCKREYWHISHVRACYSAIVLEKHKEADIPQHWNPEVENLGISLHDHTKDEFYFFVTILAFSFNLKEELPGNLLQCELDRHFTLEPHHPE